MAENIFQKIENGKVVRIVVSPEVLALGYWGDPSEWSQVEVDDGES